MGDPFRGTLLALPLVVAGFWLLGQWIRQRGGQVVPGLQRGLELVTLGALLLVILGSDHLGLAARGSGLEQVLAGGLALVLAHHTLAVVRGLAETWRAEMPGCPPWPFFALPLLVYVAILPWAAAQREPDGDEPYYLLIAHSLAYDLDTELTNNYSEKSSLEFMSRALEPEWADPVRSDGRRFSRHSLVLPAVLAPAYRLAGKWGALVTMAGLSALLAWLSLSVACRYWPERPRGMIGAWALLALTPPLLLYSHQVWVEVPAAILLLAALYSIDGIRRARGSQRHDWVVLGLVIVLLPWLKLRFVLISLPLLVLAWWRRGRHSRTIIALISAAFVVVIAGILLFNQMTFGKPFRDHTLGQLLGIQGSSPGDYVQGLTGLFWDCAFGLFATNPLWLLLIPALLWALWRRLPLVADLLICAVPYLAVITPRTEWYGAWAPPFRYGMVLLPVLALLLVPLMERGKSIGTTALVAVLSATALSVTLLWVVVPGWTYNLAAGTNHLIDHLSIRLAADVGRFLPSMVRVRAASWWVPAIVAPLVIVLWWLPGRRSHNNAAWAVAIVLVAVAALPVAAGRVPTRWIEFEDHQVEKRGGQLFPDPWVPFRPQHRGGWSIADGDSVHAPVAVGGERVSIRLDVQPRQLRSETALEMWVGEQLLETWQLDPRGGHRSLLAEDHDWPAGERLIVRLDSNRSRESTGTIVLDRARFDWR